MNAKRMVIVLVVLAAVLALGLTAVSAQMGNGRGGQGGNGAGAGNGNQNAQQTGTGNQLMEQNAAQNETGPLDGTGNQFGQRGGNPDAGMNGGGFMLNLPDGVVDELPEDTVALMLDGWLDEQHAYAVYTAVIAQFGDVRPFTNILSSEAQHIAAWETLFERYGIAVPEVPGFDVPAFASLADACALGAAAEVANFDLYDSMLAAFEAYPDLTYVAEALRDASEYMHLSAFENCAS
ncbi:MAG: hypothetical protein IPO91_23155 [Chloroflexi bacterium]|nr:hypothetical protein [Chloroflexota bacterium]